MPWKSNPPPREILLKDRDAYWIDERQLAAIAKAEAEQDVKENTEFECDYGCMPMDHDPDQ